MQKSLKMQGQELIKLNAVRVIVVLMIALGYASTMPIGPGNPEKLAHLGIDPSWIGIQILFFLSGFLALRSFARHGSGVLYLKSRILRNIPLLAFVTIITVLFLYPVFGTVPTDLDLMIKTIGLYFLGTVTCLKPGEPLPGLLDNAKYMCLIQGAIWTLKWGLIAHLGAVMANAIGILKKKILVLALAILSVIGYFVLYYANVKSNISVHSTVLLAARLAWPFLAGMAVFAYKDRITKSTGKNLALTAAFIALATFSYLVLPWTPAIEILLTCGWGWLAMTIIRMPAEKMSFLNQWPAWALAIYLINWPAAQILLLSFPGLTPWQLVGITLPVTLLIAALAHYLISGPSYESADRISLKTA